MTGTPTTTQRSAPVHQPITPELRRWIVEQAQAGHGAEAVLERLVGAGWDETVAMDAMESTLTDHLAVQRALMGEVAQAAAADSAAAERRAHALVVPEPAMEGAPSWLDAGDRRVPVVMFLASPRLLVLANVLSNDECDALVEAARPRLSRSLTVVNETGGDQVHADRTSQGMFFTRGESPLIRTVEARLAHLLAWPVHNGEGLQVLHYGPGAQYKPHFDYFDPTQPGTAAILRRGGQRVATVLLYLNEPEAGGGTVFPDVGLTVVPRKGYAVFFSYDRPHPDTRSLHGGAPVGVGEKWIATKWLREREFK
jgi:prolyl 4-hydroxylase